MEYIYFILGGKQPHGYFYYICKREFIIAIAVLKTFRFRLSHIAMRYTHLLDGTTDLLANCS